MRKATILVDNREKRPLTFPAHLTMLDPSQPPTSRRVTRVALSVVYKTLVTGDYLLAEVPDRIIVERKGHLSEVASNCLTSQGRRKFADCCRRLHDACDLPVLLLEGTVAQLIRGWKDEGSPWLAVDALQRLCLEHGIQIRYLPTTASNHKRAVGEEIAHLLVNGAITCLPQIQTTTTSTATSLPTANEAVPPST